VGDQGPRIHRKGNISLWELLKSIKENEKYFKAGGIGVFIGVVRGEGISGEKVKKLKIEAYEEKANEALDNICEELRNKKGVIDAQIHHFIGDFDVGEDLVYVVVAGAHRDNVFSTLKEAVELYKKEAPLFKKEYIITEEGATKSYWVSEQ